MPVFAFRLFREGYGVHRFYHRDIPVLLQQRVGLYRVIYKGGN